MAAVILLLVAVSVSFVAIRLGAAALERPVFHGSRRSFRRSRPLPTPDSRRRKPKRSRAITCAGRSSLSSSCSAMPVSWPPSVASQARFFSRGRAGLRSTCSRYSAASPSSLGSPDAHACPRNYESSARHGSTAGTRYPNQRPRTCSAWAAGSESPASRLTQIRRQRVVLSVSSASCNTRCRCSRSSVAKPSSPHRAVKQSSRLATRLSFTADPRRSSDFSGRRPRWSLSSPRTSGNQHIKPGGRSRRHLSHPRSWARSAA